MCLRRYKREMFHGRHVNRDGMKKNHMIQTVSYVQRQLDPQSAEPNMLNPASP